MVEQVNQRLGRKLDAVDVFVRPRDEVLQRQSTVRFERVEFYEGRKGIRTERRRTRLSSL